MCLNIRSDMLKIRYAKIRLGRIWAKAHMGQGPYGPRPIWAKAHIGQGPLGPGPLGPGPFLVGQTPHQKTHPGKQSQNYVFLCIFWKQKRCAASVRSFWRRYRAEISAMCQKTKVSVFEKRHTLVVDYLSICEFATRRRL